MSFALRTSRILGNINPTFGGRIKEFLSSKNVTSFLINQRSLSTAVPSELNVGFIGYGKMATALIKGFIKGGLIQPKNVRISDRSVKAFSSIQSAGMSCTTDNKDVVSNSNVIFLAVKPKSLHTVLKDIAPAVTSDKIIISIAAGITLQTLQDELPSDAHVIRVMPNTPCLLLTGCSVFSLGRRATEKDGEVVRGLIESTGLCEEVSEDHIDAIVGLSGSGPAYMYVALEAMSDGGVKLGLPRDLSLRFAAQTMMGSAKMVLETGSHPAVLKDDVTSPGGSTICALHVLEERQYRSTIISAIQTSAKRSKEMA